MHPKKLSIKDYTYSLPDLQIARFPLPERDASKLLVYDKGVMLDDYYSNITDHLPGNAFLIFNDTRVIEARLLFSKPSGGVIEIFCLEPHEQYADITMAMLEKEKVLWKCLVGGASKWKRGQILEKKIERPGSYIFLSAALTEKRDDCFIVELAWSPGSLSFSELLQVAGSLPLPPYLKRTANASDDVRYQTVYAKQNGSVAAPTAGLHFTDSVFEKIKAKKINWDYVTLHVGAGTFMPVKSDTLSEHFMHEEFLEIALETLDNIITHLDGCIVAVGTTSLRTIESLYWIALKIYNDPDTTIKYFSLDQWDPYENKNQKLPARELLRWLRGWMLARNRQQLFAKTRLLIAPGYFFQIVKGLITNFHQPQSTLLLLVAAFIGDDWKKMYETALERNYRFLSYGDGCIMINGFTPVLETPV